MWFCGFYPALLLNEGFWPGGYVRGLCPVTALVAVAISVNVQYVFISRTCQSALNALPENIQTELDYVDFGGLFKTNFSLAFKYQLTI